VIVVGHSLWAIISTRQSTLVHLVTALPSPRYCTSFISALHFLPLVTALPSSRYCTSFLSLLHFLLIHCLTPSLHSAHLFNSCWLLHLLCHQGRSASLSTHYTLTIHSLYTTHYTLHIIHWSSGEQCRSINSLYTIHYTLYTMHWTSGEQCRSITTQGLLYDMHKLPMAFGGETRSLCPCHKSWLLQNACCLIVKPRCS
jgi:hypothetical protein